MAIISLRDNNGQLIENIDLGTISSGQTSNSFTFRVYNNFEQLADISPAYGVKVGLAIFKYSKTVNVFTKALESYIIRNGILEIDCTISSKLNGGYPNIDWTPITIPYQENAETFYFFGEEFDIIYPDAPNNFNEYKIRLANFPSESYFKSGSYKIFIRVIWSDKES